MGIVLVADDDPDIRTLVAFKLRQRGHQVIEVADGPSAVRAARESGPDVAIVDVSMPGMSGLEVCTALRAGPQAMPVPVILLTARANPAERDAGLQAGAAAYVTKPFSPRDLVERVDQLLAASARSA